jgi:hypothetical protein
MIKVMDYELSIPQKQAMLSFADENRDINQADYNAKFKEHFRCTWKKKRIFYEFYFTEENYMWFVLRWP